MKIKVSNQEPLDENKVLKSSSDQELSSRIEDEKVKGKVVKLTTKTFNKKCYKGFNISFALVSLVLCVICALILFALIRNDWTKYSDAISGKSGQIETSGMFSSCY